MKGYAKVRLAVFLCILMVLPSIVSILPMTAQEVSAAESLSMDWFYEMRSDESTSIKIEKGAKFYIGDYAYITDDDTMGTATMFSKAKYTSSKKNVASVSSKGLLTAKKTGSTVIKIKYKGKTISRKFQVVGKGTLSKGSAAKGLQKAINKVKSSMPSKITKSNALKYIKIKKTYVSAAGNYASDITNGGFLYEEIKDGNYSYKKISNSLAVPDAGRYHTLDYLLYKYSDKNSPTSTRSSKALKISSVSANTKQITIKLKKAVTAEHILAANIDNVYYNNTPNKTKANVYVYVYDKTAQEVYSAIGTLKKGSKTVTVKLQKSQWVGDNYVTTDVKLKKGHVYQIGAKELSWGNGKKVKVK